MSRKGTASVGPNNTLAEPIKRKENIKKKEDKTRLFTVGRDGRMRGNGHKLQQERKNWMYENPVFL